MNIALTGGGTAGHVMPNLALYDEFQKRFDNIIYIGNKEKIEYDLCAKNNIDFFACESIKFDRSKIFSNLLIPFKMPAYIRQAQAILSNNSIDVVFSKGGFVAVPVVLAAKHRHIPVVIHESDMTPGFGGGINGGNSQSGIGGKQTMNSPEINSCRQGTFGNGGEAEEGGTAGGGGGGWYGGDAGEFATGEGGAGGSGYALHSASEIPPNYKVNNPNYYFNQWELRNGDSFIPLFQCNYGDMYQTELVQGNEGHGHARITLFYLIYPT